MEQSELGGTVTEYGVSHAPHVQGLEINCAAWLTIFLGTDYHSVAPGHRRGNGSVFDNAKLDVLV